MLNKFTSRPINIPIKSIGPGSQPNEEKAMTIGVPDTVETYVRPRAPEISDNETATRCRQLFIELYQEMKNWNQNSNAAGPSFALNHLDPATLNLVNQMLGEGEVSIIIKLPQDNFDEIRIQESFFVGVWRVCYYKDGKPISDQIEVSAIPACVPEAAYLTSKEGLNPTKEDPEAMNSPAILAELNAALKSWEPGAPAKTFNLSHLPMTPADNQIIDTALGMGAVHMMSRGFGNCHILSTDVRHAWRIQYFNNAPTRLMILNTIVVCGLPEEALASAEDLQDSVLRIKELVEWVTSSWELSPVELS